MSFTHAITQAWSRGNESVSKQVSKSADSEKNLDIAVPENSTNLAIAFTCDVSELQSLYLVSTVNMTLKTNSTSSPQETLTLVANEPVIWWDGNPLTMPFAGDITALYATTGAVGDGTLSIRSLIDATP